MWPNKTLRRQKESKNALFILQQSILINLFHVLISQVYIILDRVHKLLFRNPLKINMKHSPRL